MKTSRSYEVPSFLTNPKSFLTLRYLLGYMMEVAFIQANEVEKEEWFERYAWVVYSWDVEILEPIKAYDQIEVTTHSIDMRKFYAYRNFSIKRGGEICAKAYCLFLLIDRKRMRPVKIPKEIVEAYGKEDSFYEGRDISLEDNFTENQKIQIRKVDLDKNRHVNNAAYMDLIFDIVDIEDQDVSYFKIVYKNEIRNKEFVIGESSKKDKEIDFRLCSENKKVYTYGKMLKRDV